jgi:ATP-dependent exoDNAse (exonuclease V) beta subunit
MPVVLPEMSKSLEESLFAAEARMEKASDWLDGINLLYVAFTRAVDALYVMAPEFAGTSGGSGNSGSLLNEALAALPDTFILREEEPLKIIKFGELPAVVRGQREQPIEMDQYTVSEPRGSLRLRTGGALPQDDLKLEETGGRVYGIMMHELLSRITTTEDIEEAVDHACATGMLPLTRRHEITSRLHRILSSEKVRSWFNGSLTVMTEASIILPTGAARRPDRIMIGEDEVTVVDYKFGEQSSRHRQQAATYRDLLTRMGYANVRSYLWYVMKEIIEEA